MLDGLIKILSTFFTWVVQTLIQFGTTIINTIFATLTTTLAHIDPGTASATTGMQFFGSLGDWFPADQVAAMIGIMGVMTTIFLAVKAIDWVMDIIP